MRCRSAPSWIGKRDWDGRPTTSIEEIIVTGEFRSDPLDALPSSVSVMRPRHRSRAWKRSTSSRCLAMMPNVNAASGARRAPATSRSAASAKRDSSSRR